MRKYGWPIILGVIALLIIFGGALVSLYTDWLWFKDLGYSKVFSTNLLTRVQMGLLFGVLFFAFIYSNLWYARRIAPPPSPAGLEQQLIDRLGSLARRGIGLLIFVGSIVVSAMVGLEAATHWDEWLRYFHSTPFSITDPVFHKDIGFYVFQLPFLNYLYYWLFFALAASTIAAAALHYADEAIEVFGERLQFAPGVKTHLGILIAAMLFLKAWGYRLSMYSLLSTRDNLFDGAGYTAVHARIPVLWILLVVAIIAGLLVLLNIRRRGITFAVAGIVLLVGASILVGGAYPAIVQQFSVVPNELEKESPYIKRAIANTRQAYGLTEIVSRPFEAATSLTAEQVNTNSATIENIRLWDQVHLQSVYNQTQTINQYYHFQDLDVDRYWLTDRETNQRRYRQVWLSARELSQELIPETSKTWVNKHLQYTHGYGFVMSPVNEVTEVGLPHYFVYDIPPKTNVDLPIDRPGVYFGEMTDDYVFVKTNSREFDYLTKGESKTTTYDANAGVGVGGFFRKIMFALRFSDVNILLNDNIKPESKVLFQREVDQRVRKLLPFLQFDEDPYLVTVKGRLYWMRDAYTLTDAYPYSKHTQTGAIDFNYIRNSVKVVADTYTGKVDAYIIDKPLKDPIAATYSKIYPGILKPIAKMPRELRDHIRYPENLFQIQTAMYQRYHMNLPTEFYNNSDLWDIPMRAELTGQSDEGGEPMQPYYIIMKLPNGTDEEFIIMNPYIRAGKKNMVAWMCAKCDEPDYGKLVLYQFPETKNVFGPQQIAARASQNPVISQQISLWNQSGSNVSSGNLLVIPIESSLLYVMPVYLVSSSTQIPELKRVIVALGDKVAMEPTLNEALAAVVGAPVARRTPMGARTPTAAPTAARPPAVPGVPPTAAGDDVTRLVNQAASQLERAEQAQRKGDWAAYGEQVKALNQTIKELQSRTR